MLITTLALAMLTQTAPEWHSLVVKPDKVVVIDRASIRRRGSRSLFWTLTVNRELDPFGGRYFMIRHEIDCSQPDNYDLTHMVVYDDDDEVIGSFNPEASSPVAPGTLGVKYVALVCQNEWTDEVGETLSVSDYARQVRSQFH